MSTCNSIKQVLALLGVAALATGCSDSTNGNALLAAGGATTAPVNTSAAAINSGNAESMGRSAALAMVAAIEADAASKANPLGVEVSSTSQASLREAVFDVTRSLTVPASAIGVTLSSDLLNADSGFDFFCGGSISFPGELISFDEFNSDISFENLCFDDGFGGEFIMNGRVITTLSGDLLTTIYDDMTFSSAEFGTETLNFSESCNTFISSFDEREVDFFSCNISSTFIDEIDGGTNTLDEFSVSGNEFSGFQVDATFNDSDLGVVTVVTDTPFTLNCDPEPQPGFGTISYTSSNGSSGTMIFSSCAEYQFCFIETLGGAEICELGLWADL